MSDPSSPDSEKSRRSRSFGSFLLVLLVLMVVLAIVGGESISPRDELSQDQYEWYLNQGGVIEQQFRGNEQSTNRVRGKYRKPGKGVSDFEVKYADLDTREDEFRELKSIRRYETVSARRLLEAVAAEWIHPVDARVLTGYTAVAPPAEADAAPTPQAPPRIEVEERLLVHAVVAPVSERDGDGAVVDPAASELLPDATGNVHFDVQLGPDDDLAAVTAQLSRSGAALSRRSFDLTPGEGTTWEDSTSFLTAVLVYAGPGILVIVILMIFMRQMRAQGGAGGVMSFGRSRAQLYSKENLTNITFDDVAGADEAKAEVREIVEFLKNPSRFTRIGGRIPRGVLLVGPPGCGKTLLAKAIAGEAEVPFFSISGSDFVEMFVGVGASRVRDLFKQARENSPCIIFLDEIDAVGRRRGSGMGGGHDEREQTLNAILVEMDGFGTDEGIIVVAATNRPDVLDPALLRPGRFDREVVIDLPDLEGRREILEVHVKRVKAAADVDTHVLAKSTPGYSGADLAAIINEAAIMAVLAKRDAVTMDDLEEARDKVRYGRQKKSRKLEEFDRKITAYHEAGHAVVASIAAESETPHKVTIVPRGRALGATMVLPDKESYHLQRKKLLSQLAMLFGGRVAEAEFCGDISAGASDDIRRATDLARAMVSELGMSEKIGPINYSERQGSDFLGTELLRGKLHSEETAREIDEEVHRILREAYVRAEEIIRSNKSGLENLAQALLTYETVTGSEIQRLLAGEDFQGLRPPPAKKPDKPAVAPGAPGAIGERTPEEDRRKGELPGSPGLSPA